jgi:putative PIN family toxin of toxin-antitoxin system
VRLVIDTNVLVSACFNGASLPARLITVWREGQFVLLTAPAQLEEFMRVTRYKKIRERLMPSLAGRLVNEIRDLALLVPNLPAVTQESGSTTTLDNLLRARARAYD